MIIELDDVVARLHKENPTFDEESIHKDIAEQSIITLGNSTALTFGKSRVDENLVDLLKPTWVTNLQPYRQTSCINFRGMIDSFRSQGIDIKSDIVDGLHDYNPRYSETYLMDTDNWTDLGAFLKMLEIVKDKTGNPNPRQFMQHGLFSGFMKSVLQIVDWKLKVAPVISVYELLPEETRSANYDLITQYLWTKKEGNKRTSRFNMKYFNNFRGEIPIDHKWWVISIIAGLAKRKKKDFATPNIRYFEEDLLDVLQRDYAYMGWDVKRLPTGEVTIDGEQVSHPVAFERKVEECNIHPMSKMWQKFTFIKEREIYAPTPMELDVFAEKELFGYLETGKLRLGDIIDVDRADEFDHIIRKGEVYGMTTTLVDFCYSTKRETDISGFNEDVQIKKTFAERITGIGRKEEERARLQLRTQEAIKQAQIAEVALTNEKNIRENLEDLVKERTAELTKANRDLKDAQGTIIKTERLRATSVLVSNLAHKLKNPNRALTDAFPYLNKDLTDLLTTEIYKVISLPIKTEYVMTILNHACDIFSNATKKSLVEGVDLFIAADYIAPHFSSEISSLELEEYAKLWYTPQNIVELEPIFECTLEEKDDTMHTLLIDFFKKWYNVGMQLRNTGDSATELSNTITSVLRSVRTEKEEPTSDIYLTDILDEAVSGLDYRAKKKVTLQKTYQELPPTDGFPQDLYYAFVALLENAYDAVGKEGKIEINAMYTDENFIIQIKDNGVGIPQEIQGEVLEPFISTKDRGEGSGLGTYEAYRTIVEKHKGNLSFESEPGNTIWTITLPSDTKYLKMNTN